MTELQPGLYNSDDELHDTCPTCGSVAHTQATLTATGHEYRHGCSNCDWGIPLAPATLSQVGP